MPKLEKCSNQNEFGSMPIPLWDRASFRVAAAHTTLQLCPGQCTIAHAQQTYACKVHVVPCVTTNPSTQNGGNNKVNYKWQSNFPKLHTRLDTEPACTALCQGQCSLIVIKLCSILSNCTSKWIRDTESTSLDISNLFQSFLWHIVFML